jgi:hypothetical protein
MNFYVNVWHGFTHKPDCADEHGLRNAEHVGMVTGEEIESGWASLNHLQYAIREMDSGGRQDAITIHMLHLNDEKRKRMRMLHIKVQLDLLIYNDSLSFQVNGTTR